MEYKSVAQIINELSDGQVKPIYLLHGDEAFFIDEITEHIEDNVLTDAEKAFNQVVLYGRDIDSKQIMDECRQYPMMSQKRVVIIKEAQDFKELKEMGGYISNPSPHTVLVIAHMNKKIDGRISWVKEAKKSPHVVMFESGSIKEYHLAQWVKEYLQSKGRKINPEANQLLCDYLGTDLKKLVNEIEKLELNIPSKKTIDADDIERYVGISKEYNIFELNKVLGKKDILRSHAICHNLGDNIHKSPLQMMIPAMTSHFQRAHIVKRLGSRDKFEIARLGKIPPFAVPELSEAAQNYSEESFRRIFELLLQADAGSKGVDMRRGEPAEVFKELVSNILLLK
jgi:DNA polymerase-3 subunit delta